jgi:hypothetical protein
MSETTRPLPTSDLEPPTPSSSGVHPVNVLHLVMGVAFAGIVVLWALVESGAVGATDLRWLLPIPWVAAGVAGLVATAPRLRGPRTDGD